MIEEKYKNKIEKRKNRRYIVGYSIVLVIVALLILFNYINTSYKINHKYIIQKTYMDSINKMYNKYTEEYIERR